MVRAYRDYLAANENDAAWAETIAKAFEAAGGRDGDGAAALSDAALSAALRVAGVSAVRQDLTIDPVTVAGAVPTLGYANDPVNTTTGNFIEPETDVAFEGLASGLVLSRMYNSLPSGLTEPGVFGPGWTSILDQQLSLSDEGARWVLADGRGVDFPREGAGWARAVGDNYWLAREAPESASLTESGLEPGAEVLVVRDKYWLLVGLLCRGRLVGQRRRTGAYGVGDA